MSTITKDSLLEKLKDIEKNLSESSENYQKIKSSLEVATNIHNSLIGKYSAIKELYDCFEKSEET